MTFLQQMHIAPASVMVVKVKAAEINEMWSFVQSKQHQRWLWQAIDHRTGTVLAYVLASHEDTALKYLQQLLAPFSIGQFYTDGWGAYLRLLDQQHHTDSYQAVGSKNDLFFQVRTNA